MLFISPFSGLCSEHFTSVYIELKIIYVNIHVHIYTFVHI